MAAKISVIAVAAIAACLLAPPAGAAQPQYEFLAAPQINLSLVYRLDKLTGDVIACQFAHNPGRADVGPGAFGSHPAIAAAMARPSRSPATMASSPPGTSRKAACSGSITAPAPSVSAIFISSAKSRATTKRSRTNMSSARLSGTNPRPHGKVAQSARRRKRAADRRTIKARYGSAESPTSSS